MIKKACIFDLDGTLLNTLPSILYSCNHTLDHFGLSCITELQCRDLCRFPISSFYHKLLEYGGCSTDEQEKLAEKARVYDLQFYMRDPMARTEPFEGIVSVIDSLKTLGVATAVLTNKPAPLADTLASHFFPGLFDLVVGQTPNTISKPDPRSLTGLLDRMNLQRHDCIYVGDTDVDMETAKCAGVDVCAVTWGYQPISLLQSYRPDYVVSRPSDLLNIFQ